MRLLSRSLVLLVVTVLPLIGLCFVSGLLDSHSAPVYAVAQPRVYTARGISETFTVLPTPTAGNWADISGNCVVYRGASGVGVYLVNLTSGVTTTITGAAEPDGSRKVTISRGMIVWHSDISGEGGLWGYYAAGCNDSMFAAPADIGPFHVISRSNAHAPALSGEMLTFDTWEPAGAWYVAMLELDADDNAIPDAAEPGYDPTDPANFRRLTCCAYGQNDIFYQRVSAIYWDDTYQIACWHHVAVTGTLNRLECNELSNWQDPTPWQDAFVITEDAAIQSDYSGVIAVHRDLVVWTTAREWDLTGYDIYIADLDGDDDGIFDAPDDISIYRLVDWPWHQQFPDIEWPFVVWTEYRNENQADIYAYDLSLDSNGDGIPNWKDVTRFCIDPAEFPVATGTVTQIYPELFGDIVIWLEGSAEAYAIYGAYLVPEIATPRPIVSGTPLEKAEAWLDRHTIYFPTVNDIPGYDPALGLVKRYKSYLTLSGTVEIIEPYYPAMSGSYLTSFDGCYFGTPDQKRYLGRFGRGSTYDQALYIIARTMLGQQEAAADTGRYMMSFLNGDVISPIFSDTVGFSMNGQGPRDEKDNFYDMTYIRNGTIGWLGYSYLFHTGVYSDAEFLDMMTALGDYLLTQQITATGDNRYGLFTGGYGSWPPVAPDTFIDEPVGWVAAEHNIDIYFFLRDLGEVTGNPQYTAAANTLVEGMETLWDEELGRLHQGIMNVTGTLDTTDALDASSWGAMYWMAIGRYDRAERSLLYADAVFQNTVVASNTVEATTIVTVTGYGPYTYTPDLVWSEGSLGVAMAYLKLGHGLIEQCGDPYGYLYITRAQEILHQMEILQTLDPQGGLFYSIYPGEEITDFARMPSAAGTTWYIMVAQVMDDPSLRDAFWGPGAAPSNIICPSRGLIYLPVVATGNP